MSKLQNLPSGPGSGAFVLEAEDLRQDFGMSSPPPPHASAAPLVLSDDQLSRLSKEDLISRLRARENECVRLMKDRAQLMKDVNRTLQLHLAEVRGLREVNQAIQKDNAELRDLSCFLDDDRLKARKIAKEWQKFGKYTSTVMRQEVTAYQMKLYELEQKQENLLRENLELKELCVYLDDDREKEREGSQSRSHEQSRNNSLSKQQSTPKTSQVFPAQVMSSSDPSGKAFANKASRNYIVDDNQNGVIFNKEEKPPQSGALNQRSSANLKSPSNQTRPHRDGHLLPDDPPLSYQNHMDRHASALSRDEEMANFGTVDEIGGDISQASSSSTSTDAGSFSSSNLDSHSQSHRHHPHKVLPKT